jgi:hypothetical protein
VQLPRTHDFEHECDKFAFAGSCECCAHFDPTSERCRHEYPTAPHRERAYRCGGGQANDVLTFCKEFELA